MFMIGGNMFSIFVILIAVYALIFLRRSFYD
jgi:hypothetical protein